ncbi:MAG: GFA family protein [Gammaproteobacteria bacterium]|nr:GFA family protein [Gammaproteobacteria bacterium]MBT8094071.1 GFA family protein [Gammaproteobacteria bacterium]
MLIASCHCGEVRIEMSRKPRSLTQCTCSVCRRYGARWAYCTRRTARVRCQRSAVTPYTWGDRSIEFYHCNRCGCLTHYESVEKGERSRIAVNARMLPPEDTAGIRLRTFDGASTWKYLDD